MRSTSSSAAENSSEAKVNEEETNTGRPSSLDRQLCRRRGTLSLSSRLEGRRTVGKQRGSPESPPATTLELHTTDAVSHCHATPEDASCWGSRRRRGGGTCPAEAPNARKGLTKDAKMKTWPFEPAVLLSTAAGTLPRPPGHAGSSRQHRTEQRGARASPGQPPKSTKKTPHADPPTGHQHTATHTDATQ